MHLVRRASAQDLPALRAIERAAGEAFRDQGMAVVADDEPLTLTALSRFQEDGRAWVVTVDERPVGYLLMSLVDGAVHVDQVSVHPEHARAGLGRALLDRAAACARERGAAALTLTTFADVPWNRPYYERLGFRVLRDDELTEGLRQVQAHERASGLTAWPRVCMRRTVEP